MGLLSRLAQSFTRTATVPPLFASDGSLLSLRSIDPGRVPDWLGSRTADWSAWDNTASLADAVRTCTVVFACATFLAFRHF